MIVKYLKDEALLTLKHNQPIVFDLMKKSKSNEWVEDYLGEDCFGISKIKVDDIKLDTSFEKPIDSDIVNAKIIFNAFIKLNETQAIDERLWAGLAFGDCYDYLVYRWTLASNTSLTYRWLFYVDNRRKLFYHGIARLWWFAKMTYDEKTKNPFELTEFVYNHPRIMKAMTYRNFSNSELIRKTILRSLRDFESGGGDINIKLIDEFYKYISLLGSTSLIDAYNEEELYNKIFLKLFDLSN